MSRCICCDSKYECGCKDFGQSLFDLKNAEIEIEKLKADLKREQSCVDFYANRENWSWVNQNSRISLKTDHEMSLNNTHTVAGKLARLTQQQRREG